MLTACSPECECPPSCAGMRPVGAGLPAIVRRRQHLLPGKNRQRAGSYKDKTCPCPCRSWPAGDSSHEAMPVARQKSPAGWLLQRQDLPLAPVGAGLPAILRRRQHLFPDKNRQQAGSYKDKTCPCPYRSWPAGDCSHEARPVPRQKSPAGWLLQRQDLPLAPVGAGLPAILRRRQHLFPDKNRQQAGSYKDKTCPCPCRSWPAGDSSQEATPVARQKSPAGWLLQRQDLPLAPVGAGLPAILRMWQRLLPGKNRQQAGSYKDKTCPCPCRSWPAGDCSPGGSSKRGEQLS